MNVSDVMNRKIDYATPNMSVKEALKLLFSKDHTGLPVVMPRSKTLIGFLTDQDVLSKCFPSIDEYMEDIVHARDFTAMENKLKEVMKYKVGDVMYKRVTSITENEPVMKAEVVMKLKNISRLPVVDKRGRLIGMIRKRDIFKALIGKYI